MNETADEQAWQTPRSITFGLEQNHSAMMLLTAKKLLDRSGIKFMLVFGTLLGAIRDGRFIDYDTDIDIAINADQREPLLQDINRLDYLAVGFGVMRDYGWLVSLQHGSQYLDVYLFSKGNGHYVSGQYSLTLEEFEQPESLNFCGEVFQVPHSPKNYLLKKYGEDWCVPIVGKHATT